MASKSVTQDWDILVSYAAGDDLNNLLKDAWAGPLGAEAIDYTDDSLGYKVTMHKPKLQFSKEDIKATLNIDLEGTFWSNDWGDDDEGQTYKFEDFGYSLSLTAPIKALDGNQTLHDAKSSIVFKDDEDATAYYIILHIQNEGIEWKYVDPPTSTDTKKGQVLAKKAIEKIAEYVRSPHNTRFLDIKLGEVNNTPNSKSVKAVADLFRPKSFQMSTRAGALDIFIQTVGGYQEGKNDPIFAVDDTPFDTKDYNGAIIINHRLFQDKYLVPQVQEHCKKLAKDGDGNGKVTANKVDSGFQLELVFDKIKAVASGGYSSGPFTLDSAGSIALDFSSHPVKLNIVNNKDTMPQASWEWNHSFDVYWTTYVTTFDGPDIAEGQSATIKAEIGDNRSDIATLKDNKLDFEFQFKGDNQPKMTIPDKTTKKYKALKVTLDEFKFGLDELQYFASTNVFAPGLHFIDLKTVRAPHDVFVMGKMKSK